MSGALSARGQRPSLPGQRRPRTRFSWEERPPRLFRPCPYHPANQQKPGIESGIFCVGYAVSRGDSAGAVRPPRRRRVKRRGTRSTLGSSLTGGRDTHSAPDRSLVFHRVIGPTMVRETERWSSTESGVLRVGRDQAGGQTACAVRAELGVASRDPHRDRGGVEGIPHARGAPGPGRNALLLPGGSYLDASRLLAVSEVAIPREIGPAPCGT